VPQREPKKSIYNPQTGREEDEKDVPEFLRVLKKLTTPKGGDAPQNPLKSQQKSDMNED